MSSGVRVLPVEGIGEVVAGCDLAAEVGDRISLEDGDILVITSKVVSKAEGRVIVGADRNAVIDAESVRTVATVGDTRIVETRHGLVLAAAGIDASNTDPGTLVLLPLDPDASAATLRRRILERTGHQVAVIISDTMGRPWREGQTDVAIGVSGLSPLADLRGRPDSHGRVMDATIIAIADELAAAGDLVKGKVSQVPVAIIRGLSQLVSPDDGPGAKALVRDPSMDLFRLGTREALAEGARTAVAARRSVRSFTDSPVPRAFVDAAIAAALTAPAPHHTRPVRFVVVERLRDRLLDAMEQQWREDLAADGFAADVIERRVSRGRILRESPALVVPCLVRDGAHDYPDARRARAEQRMFDLAAGAAVEALLVQLAALGLASCWVSSALFCTDVAAAALELPDGWEPVAGIAIGYAAVPLAPRTGPDTSELTLER